jgi:transposase-like protein
MPTASRCRYSDIDRANALATLAANGGNVQRTVAQIGVPEQTLRTWKTGERHPEGAESVAPKKGAAVRPFFW